MEDKSVRDIFVQVPDMGQRVSVYLNGRTAVLKKMSTSVPRGVGIERPSLPDASVDDQVVELWYGL